MVDLADSLFEISPVWEEERRALEALEGESLRFRRGEEIRPQGDAANGLFVLKEGCVKSTVALETGGRQIVRLYFPGDLMGPAGLGYAGAVDMLTAATAVEVSAIDRRAFAKLFETHPRLGMLLYLLAQNERVALMDRLCSVGQTSAVSRVAALLMNSCQRLQLKPGPDGEVRLPFPFTQLEMGQMAGLSAVHINRVVKSMVAEGLVRWRRDSVTVLQLDRVRALAAIPPHTRDRRLAWLPWPSPPGDSKAA